MIDWTKVSDDAIKYDTNGEEEMMRAKAKERKRCKVAEQAQQEEQAQLEAERVERERVEAERAAHEAKEKRVHEDEERCKAKEEREANETRGEVKKVVMDPGCTHCSRAKTICEFLMDSNKRRVACIQCNLSKGKCQWPRDGKDTEAGPKATTKVDKGKKWMAKKEIPEPRPSQKKQAKSRPTKVLEIDEPKASGSRARKAVTGGVVGLEDKLEQLIDITGLIANNLVGLFELQEAAVENSGWIANTLKAMLDESYGFGVAVTPSDSGSSELDTEELCEEVEWLQAEGEEEEAEGEDEPMAEAE
ncbi:hypothetical protein M404DRAFT_26232 [Pisolithus tinctorius Marx 270]|uniref:Zn(2)-C6 fungal-type domain-containing protein n=1 Tax=Pisolithus tinctorius Marx 270 TaxID=870435 RepID=A0A0C3K495_PISTI|nr:hypothetical protein M404DRAFT_26232 [Pisolithus tinctorius Marx 270]